MCCCDKPNVNGQPGYRWNSEPSHTREVNAPKLEDGETLVHDEPGRCGGMDSHCHHYRVTKWLGSTYLAVRHGGGDERIRLSCTPTLIDSLAVMDSNARYWMLNAIYHAHSDGARKAKDEETARWRAAAAQKRIRTRKLPAQGYINAAMSEVNWHEIAEHLVEESSEAA